MSKQTTYVHDYIRANRNDIFLCLNVLENAFSVEHSYNMMMTQSGLFWKSFISEVRSLGDTEIGEIYRVGESVSHAATRLVGDIQRYDIFLELVKEDELNNHILQSTEEVGGILDKKRGLHHDVADVLRNYMEHSRSVLPVCYIGADSETILGVRLGADLNVITTSLGIASLRMDNPATDFLFNLKSSVKSDGVVYFNLGLAFQTVISGFYDEYPGVSAVLAEYCEKSEHYLEFQKPPVTDDMLDTVENIIDFHMDENRERKALAAKNADIYPLV